MEKESKQRTLQQNKSLHALFGNLAQELNDSGLDQRKVLKESVDIPWTPEAIKEQIWRPVQKAMLQKESTTQLTTKEIDEVFDVINRHLGDKFGLHVAFPSIETLMNDKRIAEGNHGSFRSK